MTNKKVICWDCDKVLDLILTEEVKKKTPRDMQGNHFVICKECGEKEDEGY